MASEATKRQSGRGIAIATAVALSDTRALLPARCGFPRPVEAELAASGRKIRLYLPPPCRQYSNGHFYWKSELLDGIGMPFAPEVDQNLRQAMSQDSGPVHPGVAAGTEGHQLGVIAKGSSWRKASRSNT